MIRFGKENKSYCKLCQLGNMWEVKLAVVELKLTFFYHFLVLNNSFRLRSGATNEANIGKHLL